MKKASNDEVVVDVSGARPDDDDHGETDDSDDDKDGEEHEDLNGRDKKESVDLV